MEFRFLTFEECEDDRRQAFTALLRWLSWLVAVERVETAAEMHTLSLEAFVSEVDE